MSNVKFRVKREDTNPVMEVFFELREGASGSLVLEAFNADGDHLKTILGIRPDGTLRRYSFAQVDGIQTDEEGRILLDE